LSEYLLYAGLELAGEMPHSIDEIITQNRHLAQLSLTDEDDLYPLYQLITPTDSVKDCVQNWSLITLTNLTTGGREVLLVSNKSTGATHVSSGIVAVDLGRKLVITRTGSLYALGVKAKEISQDQIVMICIMLNEIGFGKELGVAPFRR
jgi:hypothetical protein